MVQWKFNKMGIDKKRESQNKCKLTTEMYKNSLTNISG